MKGILLCILLISNIFGDGSTHLKMNPEARGATTQSANTVTKGTKKDNTTKDTKNDSNNIDTVWSPQLALQLSSMILIFGIIVFALMTYLVNKNHNPNDILRIFALPLIVVSSIFLIVVGYSQEQIAPVIGLLGTIAGYLLGSKSNKADKEDTNTKAE